MRKITYFVPYPELIPVVRRLMDQPCYQGIFVNASIQYFPIMYDVEVEDDCDLVIARGYSIHVIRERFSGAIVEIPITGSDIVKAIAQCRKNTNCQKIGLIGDYSNMKDIQSMSSLFNINFVVYVIDNPDQIEDMVKRAIEEGCDALISGSHANKCVIKNGFKVYSGIIENSEEAIARALNSAASLLKNMEYEASQMELLRLLAENVTDGLIFVDDRERIRIANANVGRIFPNRRPVAGKGFQEEFSFMTRNYLKACREKQHLDNEIYRTRDMNIAVDFTPVMIEDNYKGMIITIRDIGRLQQREAQIRTKLNEMGLYAKYQFSDIIHQSPVMEHVIQRARKFASVTSNVLVYGETGTGKELVAQSIHNASKRKNGPFVAINCASFPENLLESELFGYEEGAFTGAVKGGKAGLFEQAHNGTLFLDEVSELPVSFQGKLLRVLQEREVRRVGGKRVVKIDVRIIAATNKNLKQMIQEGLFREDLLYRLDVLNLSIPPLRKRREDIRLLAEYFLLKYKEQFETCADHFTGHAVELLCGYPFKGNIRELRNIVERLSVTVQDATVHASDVEESLGLNDTDMQPYPIQHPGQMPPVYQDSPADPIYAKEIRKEEVVSLLKECGYNKSEVARRLGINRTTLWRKMGKMGLL